MYCFCNNKRLFLSAWNKKKINEGCVRKSAIVNRYWKCNTPCGGFCLAGATMSALILTACIIWCICSIKSNRHKDGFHRLRQHHDEYEDEIRMMSTGSKKSLLSHEFQDETDTEEETLYSSKHWKTHFAFSQHKYQATLQFFLGDTALRRLSCFFKELWEVNLLNLYSLWISLAVLNFPSLTYS